MEPWPRFCITTVCTTILQFLKPCSRDLIQSEQLDLTQKSAVDWDQHVCVCVTWSGVCRTAHGSWGWEMTVGVGFIVTWGWSKTEEGWWLSCLWEWRVYSERDCCCQQFASSRALQDLGLLSWILILLTLFHPFCLFSPPSRTTEIQVSLVWDSDLKVSTSTCVCVLSSPMLISINLLWNSSQSPVSIHYTNHCVSFYSLSYWKTGRRMQIHYYEKRQLSTGHKKQMLHLCLYFSVCLQASNMLVVKKKKSFSYCFLKLPQGSKQTKIAFPNCWRKWRLYFSNLINISPSKL